MADGRQQNEMRSAMETAALLKSKSESLSLAFTESANRELAPLDMSSPPPSDISPRTHLRRSPRFPALNATVPRVRMRRLTHAAELRRSSRLNAVAVGGCKKRKPGSHSQSQSHARLLKQRSRGPQLLSIADRKDQKSVLDGKCIQEKSCRRSPRLTPTSHSESSKAKDKLGAASSNKEFVKLFKQCHAKPLRQSPRLNPSGEACLQLQDVKMSGGNVRKSPILPSSSGSENMDVISFPKKEISEVVHQKDKDTELPIEFNSDSLVKQNSEVKTITRISLEIDDTDCLRSSSEVVENGRMGPDSLALLEFDDSPPRKKNKKVASTTIEIMDHKSIPSFVGNPIPDDEAQKRWGWRYELKNQNKGQKFKMNEDEEDEIIVNVKCHYAQAEIGNCIFSLGDCAIIKGDREENHVGKIIEFFQTTDDQDYFRVQWFYRVQDTVIQDEGSFHDKRRLFYSSIMNDNLIDCIIAKANVTIVTPRIDRRSISVSPSDFYYDMEYCVEYSTFRNIPAEALAVTKSPPESELRKTELLLLDLYSGCGGMSTGLCLGAKVSSVNLVTRWAVDSNKYATESLKLNHPDTYVRNELAEDFLELLKEWEKLCKRFKGNDTERILPLRSKGSEGVKKQVDSLAHDLPADEYEVSRIVDICYGDPNETGKCNLYLKVRWRGHSESEDTWEPLENLSNCKESIQEFVRKGMISKILPLPGEVDVICGGPPCQGVSGYNRFRNVASPLDDERNRQIVVFMDIVKYLKPKYVLMENVVDILKFDNGSLGRYALSRLVHMNYQARLGMVAAGCYGLPQFRLRVFLWGAHPSEVLPQFPLPSHDVIVSYWPPTEFERNTVAYDEGQPRELEKAIVLQDAISDLPAVTNRETCEEMPYRNPPETEFQRYIRSTKYEMTGSTLNGTTEEGLLYDHRPYILGEDDYLRVCQIPKRKGANFRDLPGLVVIDNVVRRHPTESPPLLPSGKPLVPDYAFTFEQGRSKRPFGRLWWDETVPTALTFPSCHNTKILHPEQDRVLSIREFARLQGFPDYYRFCGNVKQRYRQIGNAVAVPVGRALGYALGMAYMKKLSGNEALMTLPPKFSLSNYLQLSSKDQLGKTDTD
ncbi:DNA (cytosine-5)-methyltransferase CMT2 isoform X2 [Arachis hypogaea]|uniref:DNA (cytosine-5)-methyltransferase CMT2 isoform X2 n=1 Tax=Arachis hypogaea TaxID=3818 RepID=UPI000DECDC47|nr:DNA (cytosine-5)-methyltransferase CMT2 isoform X2 [Arachis hypogaea]